MDPAILQQAVGRAHRMGQTRPVHVTRLIMHSTVEVTPLHLHALLVPSHTGCFVVSHLHLGGLNMSKECCPTYIA